MSNEWTTRSVPLITHHSSLITHHSSLITRDSLLSLEAAMHTILHDMFVVSLPIAEKIIRPILVYVALVILLRVFGKRELAQLNPFDLVVLLSLSNTEKNAIIGDDNSVTGGVIGAVTLLVTNYAVVRF